jgi:hypothetical protein
MAFGMMSSPEPRDAVVDDAGHGGRSAGVLRAYDDQRRERMASMSGADGTAGVQCIMATV